MTIQDSCREISSLIGRRLGPQPDEWDSSVHDDWVNEFEDVHVSARPSNPCVSAPSSVLV